MTEEKDYSDLNPDIFEVQIGTRKLRTISIYPLALGDQIKVTNLLTGTLKKYFESGGDEAKLPDFIQFLLKTIQENMKTILPLISDENVDDLLKEITNNQAVEIVEAIYEQNFRSAVKKIAPLAAKAADLLTENSLQGLSTDTPNTESKTSLESDSTKEESPSDKPSSSSRILRKSTSKKQS